MLTPEIKELLMVPTPIPAMEAKVGSRPALTSPSCVPWTAVAEVRGLPDALRIDNGPEFSGKTLDSWAYQRGGKLEFISPGKPTENGHIESFNGHFRDECLKMHWFASLQEAREVIETWRGGYNLVTH